MKVKALKGFAGVISMYAGETREIADDAVARDLLRAGYIVEEKVAEAKEAVVVKATPKTRGKKSR
jgi:hypothetical protein